MPLLTGGFFVPNNQLPIPQMTLATIEQVEIGNVVITTLPSDVEMWEGDHKTRPMIVLDKCTAGVVLVPLTTKYFNEEKLLIPNRQNRLSKPSAVIAAHRLFYTLEKRLKVIGTLANYEMKRVTRILKRAGAPEFHLSR